MVAVAKFTIEKPILLKTLSQMAKIVGRTRIKRTTVEITVVDDFIHLVVPGINLKLPAITESSVKFTVRLLYFKDIVKTYKSDPLWFTVQQDRVQIEHLSFKAKTTFIQNDDILRSVDLPINYKAGHLINMGQSGSYTQSEIAFNDLEIPRLQALKTLKDDVTKIALIVRKYGFSRKEVDRFIKSKIQKYR